MHGAQGKHGLQGSALLPVEKPGRRTLRQARCSVPWGNSRFTGQDGEDPRTLLGIQLINKTRGQRKDMWQKQWRRVLGPRGRTRCVGWSCIPRWRTCTGSPWTGTPLSDLESVLCCCSVAQSCPTLCHPMDCSMPGFPSFTISPSVLKLMVIGSMMPSSHLILCCPLLLLPSVFPSIRVFSNKSMLGKAISGWTLIHSTDAHCMSRYKDRMGDRWVQQPSQP